jgi:hypothetical protein
MQILERLMWKFVAAVKWLVSVWSEGGSGSSSRIHLVVAFLSAVGLCWHAQVTQHDIPVNAYMLACALLGTGAINYGVNKVTGTRKTKDEA